MNSCKQITDSGVKHLKEGIRPLVSLKQLSLDFSG